MSTTTGVSTFSPVQKRKVGDILPDIICLQVLKINIVIIIVSTILCLAFAKVKVTILFLSLRNLIESLASLADVVPRIC